MSKIGRGVAITAIAIATVGLGIGGYELYKFIKSGLEQNPANKGLKEQINEEKEEEEKLLEEIKNDTPDKKPEDIVVPPDASEEEKQEIEKEKQYWTIVDEIKSKASEKISSHEGLGDISAWFKFIRRINDLYVGENNELVIDCDVIYAPPSADGETINRQQNIILSITDSQCQFSHNSLQDVEEFLSSSTNIVEVGQCVINQKHDETLNSFFETYKAKIFYDEVEKGYDIELLDITQFSVSYLGFPKGFVMKVKLTNGENVHYEVRKLNAQGTYGKTAEDWEEFVSTNDDDVYFLTGQQLILYPTQGFSWQEEVEKYSQQAQENQAEATSASEFDYNAYKERKENKTETKNQEEKAPSDGYELEL